MLRSTGHIIIRISCDVATARERDARREKRTVSKRSYSIYFRPRVGIPTASPGPFPRESRTWSLFQLRFYLRYTSASEVSWKKWALSGRRSNCASRMGAEWGEEGYFDRTISVVRLFVKARAARADVSRMFHS